MIDTFKNLTDFHDFFKDEATCREYLAQKRWNGKPVCPYCKNTKVYKIEGGKRYKCANNECYKKFSVTVNSIFEDTNVPLRTWFLAIYLCTSHKKGISSVQLAKDCGVTQKTAWHLEHRIREMLRAKAPVMLSNEVEIDETYIGGVEGNKHYNKRAKGKRFTTVAEQRKNRDAPRLKTDKAVVLGLVERDGKVVAKQIPHARVEHILPLIDKHIEKGSTMLTDEYYAYGRVEKLGYTHKTVNHGLKVYVIGDIHTNTIENFWSVLKRGLYGIYHYTSKKHLDRYLDEFCARYNTRGLGEAERFNNFLTQCGDTTLPWKNLVQAKA